jgi:hypothetical protein
VRAVAVLAEPIVRVLLGEKWQDAVPIIQSPGVRRVRSQR